MEMSETNDVDEETFGDAAADVDAGVGLPDFFTTKDTSGDQEFTSLMQDLKAAALADDGADSGAGGLDSLLDPRDVGGLPDFFKTAAGGALTEEALSRGGDGGGGGGGRNTSLFDPLASFDLRSEGQEDDGASLFASLGLETAEQQRRRHQQQQQQQQRELQQREQQQREQQQREQQQREQQQREHQQREHQQREQQQREQQQREQQQREQQQREHQQREQQQREQQQREQQQREQQQREQLQKQLQQQQQQQQQEEEVEDFLSPPSVGGDPGECGRGLGGVLRHAEDDAFGGTDQSEWDKMQKQFEDMHKSFLQDYRQIEEDEDDGALDSAADEGKQTAFATMRQLSLDDLDPSPDDDTETEEAAAARVGGTPGPLLTGPNVLPPGAKTLEELEAAMITVSPASIRSPPSLAAVARAGTTPPGLTRSDGPAGPGTPGVLERQAVSGDKRIVRGAGEGGRGGEEVRQEEVVVSSQGMAWRQAQHQHLELQQQQKQHSVGIQAQLGSDGVPPQVNLLGGARAGPPPPPPVGQHRQGSVMLPARSGHPLSTVGGLPPSPQMGNAMLQGRKPPHHFQQHQQHQQLQQHQQHQQHQQQGFPGFPSPGMPPFHTLPPHVQAHFMQRRAMAHARTTGAPPRPSQPPHPPRFGSGGGSGGAGGGSAPGLPVLPQQQQHLQQQQQQHSGRSIPRSGVLAGVPMMSPGQQAFTQRESGGGGVRAPPGLVMPTLQSPTPTYPHPPTPWFGRPPMPPPSPILTPQQQHLQQHQHHHMQHIQHMHGGNGSRPDARPPLPPLEMFPRGELMTAYDTRYVIMAQMRALETPDPFNDDFYFHNAMRRKQERSLREGQAREGQGLEGLRGGDAHARARETAPAMPMPLPVWQETKEIARKVKDEQADAVKKRIRQWESENRVLGHHARSDVHRPRALLSLSGAGGEGEDGEGGSTDGDVLVSGGAPFETHLWRARLAIQRATKAMLAAYELNYLLHLPTTPHAKKVEVAGRLRNVIVDLAVSLGLQRSTILQQVKPPVLPLPMKTDDGRPPPDASTLEASLDLRVLSTVLELTKGQKLLSRCLTMLPPGQRSALVPSVLALTLARAPAANLRNAPSDQVKADAIKAEETLAHELKNVVQSPASLPLPILRRCVELVMTAHRGRGSLAAALGSVSRAEVLAAVLRKGGELSEAEGGEAAADWAELQAEFIAMAKESPTGSQ